VEGAGDGAPFTWGGTGRVDQEVGGDRRTVDVQSSHELGVREKGADPPGLSAKRRREESKLTSVLLLPCLVGCEVVEEKTVAPASGAGYFEAELLSEVPLE
jgi:hypothetical protein